MEEQANQGIQNLGQGQRVHLKRSTFNQIYFCATPTTQPILNQCDDIMIEQFSEFFKHSTSEHGCGYDESNGYDYIVV